MKTYHLPENASSSFVQGFDISFGKEIPFQGSCARKSRRDDVGDEVRKLILSEFDVQV